MIKKAVITAAGRGERLYPVGDTVQKAMLPLVDRDGLYKPVIQIIAEEAFDSGIEEICIVCAPGDEDRYVNYFSSMKDNLLKAYKESDWAQVHARKIEHFIRHTSFKVQEKPLGYGHAVYCSREFVGNEHFLLLLSDHLYVSHHAKKRCAAQIIELAESQSCSVSAVNPTAEHQIRKYGTVTGKNTLNLPGIYQIEKIHEKPSLSLAEQELHTPGLRAGYYLCFFGIHALSPMIFEILEEHHNMAMERNTTYLLTPALQDLAKKDKYLALEAMGRRYDIGKKYGLLQAQIALSLAGQEKDRILNALVDILAESRINYEFEN
jgi:UTP--glucose-1-phosphate uridylyltransferase